MTRNQTKIYQPFLCFLFSFFSLCRHWCLIGLLVLTASLYSTLAFADNDPFSGTVIFLRHALAPGNGDPKHFDLKNCKTQRNLDEAGRQQARTIGKHIAAANNHISEIYSSEWCRCLETALLLDIGVVTPFSGLNSFYQNHVPRDATLAKLAEKLNSLPHNGAPVIMVTHYVTIQAITNISVRSGGAVLYDLATRHSLELSLSAFSPAQ